MNNMNTFDNVDGEGMEMWSKVASQLTGVPAPSDFESAVLLKTSLGALPSAGTLAIGADFEAGVFQKIAFSNLSRVQVPENFEADVLLKIRQTTKPAPVSSLWKNIAFVALPLLFVGGFFAWQPAENTVVPPAPPAETRTPVVFADTTKATAKADTPKPVVKKEAKKKRVKKEDDWKPVRGFPPKK